MPRPHSESKSKQQYLLDIFNLLDVLKLANINSSILLSFANYLIKKLAITRSIYVVNGLFATIVSCIYLIRYRHSRLQEKTLINNQIQIDQLQKECTNHSKIQDVTIKKYLSHNKINSVQHRLIAFIVNMGMFYVTSYEIIHAIIFILPVTISAFIPSSIFPVLVALLSAFHLTKHHIKNLYRQHTQEEQLVHILKRMQKVEDNPTESDNNNALSRNTVICLCLVTAVSIFTLADIKTETFIVLFTLVALSAYICHNFEIFWKHISSYSAGLVGGVSALCTSFKFIQLHPEAFISQIQKTHHAPITQYTSISIYTTFVFLFGLNTLTNEERKHTTKKILTTLKSSELTRSNTQQEKNQPRPHRRSRSGENLNFIK